MPKPGGPSLLPMSTCPSCGGPTEKAGEDCLECREYFAEIKPPRRPGKSYCDICGQQFGNAWQAVGLAQHKWEAHGIPGEVTFNGRTTRFGPEQQEAKTFRQRLQTAQFFDNRPANWAFNLLVAFPLALVLSSALAFVVLAPIAALMDRLDFTSPADKCAQEMDRQTRIECFERL